MKTVAFRFHFELNDFLTEEQRGIVFPFGFSGKVTVLELIQALGVPHSAVGLVEVDKQLMPLDYHAQDYDSFEVFPNREVPPKLQFIADMHLGKLTRSLRMLGFDTYYRNELHDPEIAERSEKEQRIVLTRDLGLLKRKQVQQGHWLRSQDADEQLEELLKRYHLDAHMRPFTRCLSCNGRIAPVTLAAVKALVPTHIAQEHTEFYQCESCAQVYWKGSHYERMQQSIRKIRGARSED